MSKFEVDHESDLEAEGPNRPMHPPSTVNKGGDRDNEITAEDFAFMREFEEAGRKKKVLRKMDLHILPVLILLYLVSFIDRSNIGNARIQGLERDLGLTPQEYSWCLTIFFFIYAPAEMPANIMLKILRPSRWIPMIMLAWGTVMTLQGIVQNYPGLLATRALLGLTEAGFFPAAIYILSNWYLREEMGRRIAYLYASASLAGSFSGLLAFAIAKMDGIAGLSGWRWIFIVEGLATVLIALTTPFIISDDFDRSKWLDADERRYLHKRVQADRQGKDKGPFKWHYLTDAFKDWKIWAWGLIFFAGGVSTYGMTFALPTIIRQLGYTSANAKLLTIPVYFAGAVTTLIVATIADKTRKRARYIIGPYSVACIGLILCIATPRPRLPGLTLFGVFLIAMGTYSSVPAVIAFCGNNIASEWTRGIALGIQIGCGSAGGIVGSNIFLAHEAPRYHTGYGIAIALNVTAQITTALMYFYLKSINKKRDAIPEEVTRAKYTPQELAAMGNDSPLFRYEL